MPKHRVSEEQFIEELNRELYSDAGYVDGMRFLPWTHTSHGEGIRGYDMAGCDDNPEWRGIYSRVAYRVKQSFEFDT